MIGAAPTWEATMWPAGAEISVPRPQRQLEARPQRPKRGLGTDIMSRTMIKGKCGLPTLFVPVPRQQRQLRRAARLPVVGCLGIDILRLMGRRAQVNR